MPDNRYQGEILNRKERFKKCQDVRLFNRVVSHLSCKQKKNQGVIWKKGIPGKEEKKYSSGDRNVADES